MVVEDEELEKLQGKSFSRGDAQLLAEIAIRALRDEGVASVVRLLIGTAATAAAAAILEECGRTKEKQELFPGRIPSTEDRSRAIPFIEWGKHHREAPGCDVAPGLEGHYLSLDDTSTIADLAAHRMDEKRVKNLVSRLTGAKALDVAKKILLASGWQENKLPPPLAGRPVEAAEDTEAAARSFMSWADRLESI